MNKKNKTTDRNKIVFRLPGIDIPVGYGSLPSVAGSAPDKFMRELKKAADEEIFAVSKNNNEEAKYCF